MAKRNPKTKGAGKGTAPKEIPMTDLGWTEDGENHQHDDMDRHAAGTPGGGSASGGLAGTNIGRGDPDDVDLEGALGSGTLDNEGEDDSRPPYAGSSGGAVGGTPAEKRASGGHERGGLAPGGTRRGDSTIGQSNGKGS